MSYSKIQLKTSVGKTLVLSNSPVHLNLLYQSSMSSIATCSSEVVVLSGKYYHTED